MSQHSAWQFAKIAMLVLMVMFLSVCQPYGKPGPQRVGGDLRTMKTRSALTEECEANPICAENALTTGVSPRSGWDIAPEKVDYDVQGFAYPISVDKTDSGGVQLRIKSASAFKIAIFRLGWYGGDGGRLIEEMNGGASYAAASQPTCNSLSLGSVDCGNWSPVDTYYPASTAVSGLYLARVTTDAGRTTGRLIPFVIRDDSRDSDVLAQIPDTTWQSYAVYDSNGSLYPSNGGPADTNTHAVSYRRPLLGGTQPDNYEISFYNHTGFNPEHRPTNLFFDTIVPTIRFLERNGIFASYTTGQQVARDFAATTSSPSSSQLLGNSKPRTFLTMGHDEYWSQEQRNNVARARRAGTHMMFLSGNDMFWKINWVNSSSYEQFRCYKESGRPPSGIEDQADFTGQWADGRYSPSTSSSDETGPENGTTGLISGGYVSGEDFEEHRATILVSPAEGANRFWRGSPFAPDVTAPGGTHGFTISELPDYYSYAIGHEWDVDLDNGARPSGIIHLSTTPLWQDAELNEGSGNSIRIGASANHHLVMWRDPTSAAITFHAGTISFGHLLDTFRSDEAETVSETDTMLAVQQGLINLFADMGLPQPASLREELAWSPPSGAPPTPTVSIDSVPAATMGKPHVISGSASGGTGARVSGIEVRIADSSNSSFRSRFVAAVGAEAWKFEWTPPYPGSFSIVARAINDFGTVADTEETSLTVTGTMQVADDVDSYPLNVQSGNDTLVWVGTEFYSDTDGSVDSIRFYNPTDRTYDVALVNLSTAAVSTASASTTAVAGWQTVAFSSPASISADTHYAALYKAKHSEGFAYLANGYTSEQFSPPIHAVAGRYSYGAASSTTQVSTLYGVDVSFAPTNYYSSGGAWRSVWGTPSFYTATDTTEVELGTTFTSSSDGYVDGVRAYLPDNGAHSLDLWLVTSTDGSRTRLASTTASGTGTGEWISALFAVPVRTFAGLRYLVTNRTWSGFAYTSTYTPAPLAPLTYLGSGYQYCLRNSHNNCSDGTNTWMGGTAGKWFTTGAAGGHTHGTDADSSYHYPVDPLYRPTASARQSLWPTSGVNPHDASRTQSGTASSYAFGTVFTFPHAGVIEAVRFASKTDQAFTVRVHTYGASTAICSASGTPASEGGSIWRTIRFSAPCAIAANAEYTVSYSPATSIDFAYSPYAFAWDTSPQPRQTGLIEGAFKALRGVYGTSAPLAPATASPYNGSYFVDIVYRSSY